MSISDRLLLLAELPSETVDMGAFTAMLEKAGPWFLNLCWKLLIALAVFLIGKKAIGFIRRFAGRSFERAGVEAGASKFLKSLIEVCLYGILVFMIAGQLGLNTASLVTILGTASLALSLSLQGTLQNFAGGVLLLLVKPFKVGEYIICPEGEGTVSMIGLVYTTLLTADNKRITIPNGSLANSTVTDVTAMEKRRLDLLVGIGYQADIKAAKEILERSFREHPLETALITAMMTDDEELIAAALLHDTVEDAGVTYRELQEQFGVRVARLVAEESEDKSKSWLERKGCTLAHLKDADRDTKLLTLADKLSNIRSMARDYILVGEGLWERFNVRQKELHAWYYTSMIELLRELDGMPEYQEYVELCRRVFGGSKGECAGI